MPGCLRGLWGWPADSEKCGSVARGRLDIPPWQASIHGYFWRTGQWGGECLYQVLFGPRRPRCFPQMEIEPGSAQLGGGSLKRGQSSLPSFLCIKGQL